jgi:L-lactate dehydrogenase complex protein LldG
MVQINPNSARGDIISAIRNNLGRSREFDSIRILHDHSAASFPPLESYASDVVAVFCENLESVGGQSTIVTSIDEAAAVLQKMIIDLRPETIALSDSKLVHSVAASIQCAGVVENAGARELFDCDVGVTSAQWAIADTGTLVLESEREFNRLTSLIPGIHICILEAEKIKATMLEIFDLVRNDLNPSMTFITGPSRTSDIELTLAIGVHGPRELFVIIVQE